MYQLGGDDYVQKVDEAVDCPVNDDHWDARRITTVGPHGNERTVIVCPDCHFEYPVYVSVRLDLRGARA